jgi:hydrogenase maturation factor HypE
MNASGRCEAASAERQAAQDLKANVAVKSDFERAQAVYAEAEQAFKAEKYDDAADLFAQAESLFADVKNVAAEKRARALEAMQNAQQKISATEDAAKKADAVLEGGSR